MPLLGFGLGGLLNNAANAATAGLNLSNTWVKGAGYFDFADTQRGSVKINLQLSPSSSGVIFEAGGTARGMVLYVYSGSLYFVCGDGSASRNLGVNSLELSWLISDNRNRLIEVSWATQARVAAGLYVDGSLASSATYSSLGILAGTDQGGIAASYGFVAHTRFGANPPSWSDPNEITSMDVFENQAVSGIVALAS